MKFMKSLVVVGLLLIGQLSYASDEGLTSDRDVRMQASIAGGLVAAGGCVICDGIFGNHSLKIRIVTQVATKTY